MAQMTLTNIYKLNNILTKARNEVEDIVGDGKLNPFINKEAERIFMALNDLCLLTVDMHEKWDVLKVRGAKKDV